MSKVDRIKWVHVGAFLALVQSAMIYRSACGTRVGEEEANDSG